jgi:hypothetical protein
MTVCKAHVTAGDSTERIYRKMRLPLVAARSSIEREAPVQLRASAFVDTPAMTDHALQL